MLFRQTVHARMNALSGNISHKRKKVMVVYFKSLHSDYFYQSLCRMSLLKKHHLVFTVLTFRENSHYATCIIKLF